MSHTKGELKYIGSASIVCIEAKGSRRISIATVLTDGIDIDTACKYPVDLRANAKRLVLCWNSHDALLDACKKLQKIKLWVSTINNAPEELSEDIEFIDAAIAAAEK